MGNGTGITVLRSIMALLVGTLGVVSLMSGRIIIGVLLIAMAFTSAAITISMHHRRNEMRERFAPLIERRRQRFAQTPPQPQP